MGLADQYASSLFPTPINNTNIRNRSLTPLEAISLSSALHTDCVDSYYSAWVTFVDALHGIHKKLFSWATVKLYYSTFYALRSSLAVDHYCIFHVNRTQCYIEATSGSNPTISTDSGTHKTVLRSFQRVNSGHPLCSQTIDLLTPFDWLVEKREAANYRAARFSDPTPAQHLRFAATTGLRKALNAYINDTTHLHTFDPDHAIISFPLQALRSTGQQLIAAGLATPPSEQEQSLILSAARDGAGQLTPLIQELKKLKVL